MSIWILQPDADGNCCDCAGRMEPCDTCGAPTNICITGADNSACAIECQSIETIYSSFPDLSGPFSVPVADCVGVKIGVTPEATFTAAGDWIKTDFSITNRVACIKTFPFGVIMGCIGTALAGTPGIYPFNGGAAFNPNFNGEMVLDDGTSLGHVPFSVGLSSGNSCTTENYLWYGRQFTKTTAQARINASNLISGCYYTSTVFFTSSSGDSSYTNFGFFAEAEAESTPYVSIPSAEGYITWSASNCVIERYISEG